MSISSGERERERYNKKMMDFINRFNYYKQNVLESSEVGSGLKIIQDINHSQAEIGCSSIHHLRQKRQPYRNQSYLNKAVLTSIAKDSLVPADAEVHHPLLLKTKAEEKKESYDQRVVDVLVIQNEEKLSSTGEIKVEKSQNISFNKYQKSKGKGRIRDYHVFVIHFPKEEQTLWSYFVQRITLRDHSLDSDLSWPIEYEAVISFPKESWFHKNVQKYFSYSPQMTQLIQITKTTNERLTMFESSLAKQLATAVNQADSEKEYDCHPEFKREAQLPPAEYKKFENLKSLTYSYFSQMNPDRKLNRYFLDNLICRFLMVKKYKEEETWKSLKDYIHWQKEMREKYTWEGFERYRKLDIFRYLGKDYEGRPVFFFRAINFLPAELDDIKVYLDYNSYLFEFFSQDQMEGYVDQFVLVADYRGFGRKNFQVGPATDFAKTNDKYCPERQYKLILFGVVTFGEWVYKILKPVLPEFVISKIIIFGNDKEPLRKEIEKHMDIRILPDHVFDDVPTDEGRTPKKMKMEEEH